MQSTSSIFLVRPASFGYNEETARTNSFQKKPAAQVAAIAAREALLEFDAFAARLVEAGVDVYVFDDTALPVKPDAIFPNNWLSTHRDGTAVLYSMCTPNRRAEKRMDIIGQLKKHFLITNIIDFSVYEKEEKYLEGTGSVVFDHVNKKAYACLSQRTDKGLVLKLCDHLEYEAVYFSAFDQQNKEIYHTNVMMCVGEQFAVVCLDAITNLTERALVIDSLKKAGKEVVEISMSQMISFAGNMLCLKTRNGDDIIVLSELAYNSLNAEQKSRIGAYCKMLPRSLPVIENIGGGSARCMIAEIFLPPR